MLQTGLIVGGWDKYEGGKIYGIPLGGTVVEQPFAIGGKNTHTNCSASYDPWVWHSCIYSSFLCDDTEPFLQITSGTLCVCLGSGSSYLYGFFDQAWKENMTKEEAEVRRFRSLYLHLTNPPFWSLLLHLQQLVVKAVSLAIARDGASGGVVRTVIVRYPSGHHNSLKLRII